jgi:putative heme-binding domain-containing protein
VRATSRLSASAIISIGLAVVFQSALLGDEEQGRWFNQQATLAPSVASVSTIPSPNSATQQSGAKDPSADPAAATVAEKTAGVAADVAAAARDAFHVLPGFKVEHLFTVPTDQLGSWVSLTVDDKGRLLVCDQGEKGLCRVTPPPINLSLPQGEGRGEGAAETKVEHLKANIGAAQGMLYAFGSLYLSVNRAGNAGGLFRLRDTKGDDQFDEIVKLKGLTGPVGEHGPHALRLSPDGKSIFMVCGNHTDLPFKPTDMPGHPEYKSLLPANWDEDLILPRLWDPNGHARNRMAPGGWIAQTDPDGKTWNMFSVGYRNCYDFDFNADGELITYDSDMEWDMGLPWYRATRIVHATPGSEFGWRSGAGNWPWYYVDSLPPMADVGPGSPVGVTFGYGSKFPAKYQRAFYACDWTFGTIYAIHLEPEGSSYKAVKEEFLSRNALPLTDITIGTDGAMYFIVGGRNLQSELYRVTYTGPDSTEKVSGRDWRGSLERATRHKIESYQGHVADDPAAAVDFLWPYLGHADRFIRYAARVALEFQPVSLWQDRVLSSHDPETLITAAVALAHQGDKAVQPQLLDALNHIRFNALSLMEQLELLRAYELALVRFGPPSDAARDTLVKRLDELYPGTSDLVNRELCNLLCNLQSPTVVAKTMPLLEQPSPPPSEQFGELLTRNRQYARPIEAMMENHPDQQKIAYAYALRNVKTGWTIPQRQSFFAFLRDAGRAAGGHSFSGYLRDIDREAFENATDSERLAIEAMGLRKPFVIPPLPKPQGPGHDWTMDEVLKLAETGLTNRDFNNGKKVFSAARCVVCHRFGADGGATGPDLTQLAGRFTNQALTESIIEPSKVIADQYKATTIVVNGKQYNGRIVADLGDKIVVVTDPEDSTKTVELPKAEIESETPSPISLMPVGLLKPLNDHEVLDLLAYLLSRGNPQDPMFNRSTASSSTASK